jgi:chlorite dismutase
LDETVRFWEAEDKNVAEADFILSQRVDLEKLINE